MMDDQHPFQRITYSYTLSENCVTHNILDILRYLDNPVVC